MSDAENQAIPKITGPRAALSLLALSLKNIGPFDSAEIELLTVAAYLDELKIAEE